MLLSIRFHGRGGQGAVTASKLLAEAANHMEYYSQSILWCREERGPRYIVYKNLRWTYS